MDYRKGVYLYTLRKDTVSTFVHISCRVDSLNEKEKKTTEDAINF